MKWMKEKKERWKKWRIKKIIINKNIREKYEEGWKTRGCGKKIWRRGVKIRKMKKNNKKIIKDKGNMKRRKTNNKK